MFEDPIVAEVRSARQEHAARFGYDLKRMAEDLRRRQALSGRKVVSFSPKRPKDAAVAGA